MDCGKSSLVWKIVNVEDKQEGAQNAALGYSGGNRKGGGGESAIDHDPLGSVGEIVFEPGPKSTSDAHLVCLLQKVGVVDAVEGLSEIQENNIRLE